MACARRSGRHSHRYKKTSAPLMVDPRHPVKESFHSVNSVGGSPRHTAKSHNMLCKVVVLQLLSGANGRSRTDDLIITNDLLYQLSYVGFLT